MRASRLLSILTTLQAQRRVTAQALADECEVSLRTIYRDIEALSAAGVPVCSDRGSEGGYSILESYKARLNGLLAHEAKSLLAIGLTGPAADLGLGSVVAAAQKKLLAALPLELRASAERMRSSFHHDAPTWFAQAQKAPLLPLVAEAVWDQRQILILYRSWSSERERRVEPLGVILKNGVWYLAAAEKGVCRTYRVSRILNIRLLTDRFERLQDFDLASYWKAATHDFEAGLYHGRATVRLSPQGVSLLMMLSPSFVHESIELSDETDADGWRTATLPVKDATLELLRLGADVEVLEPPELRAEISAIAEQLVARYRAKPSPSP